MILGPRTLLLNFRRIWRPIYAKSDNKQRKNWKIKKDKPFPVPNLITLGRGCDHLIVFIRLAGSYTSLGLRFLCDALSSVHPSLLWHGDTIHIHADWAGELYVYMLKLLHGAWVNHAQFTLGQLLSPIHDIIIVLINIHVNIEDVGNHMWVKWRPEKREHKTSSVF